MHNPRGEPHAPNSAGEHVVLMAWAAPGLTYPITRGHEGDDCDYRGSEQRSRFAVRRGETAKDGR